MVSLPVYSNDADDAGSGCGDCEARGGSESRCGNGLEKIYNTTAVRYGYMKHIGEFSHSEDMRFTCGAKVVVQTQRGIEIGEQVSLGCNGCDRHVSREQIKKYIENSGADVYMLDHGRILREATPDDLAEDMRLREQTVDMRRFAQQAADRAELPMKVVDCEYLLGGDRAVFYFMADGRVDFRNLVRDLSREFQTRIKMHQVGARDEARLLADFETCGREVCCKSFLKTLKPVTMRMAKLQRSTLDPTKVSGRCGRLKCCLRYEHDSYEELTARLPRMGERIKTAHGYGTVVNRQILTQLVQLERVGEKGLITVVIEDVVQRGLREFPPEAFEEPATREPRPPAQPRRPRTRRPSRESPRAAPDADSKRQPPDAGGSPDTNVIGKAIDDPRGPVDRSKRKRRSRRRRRGKGPSSDPG